MLPADELRKKRDERNHKTNARWKEKKRLELMQNIELAAAREWEQVKEKIFSIGIEFECIKVALNQMGVCYVYGEEMEFLKAHIAITNLSDDILYESVILDRIAYYARLDGFIVRENANNGCLIEISLY